METGGGGGRYGCVGSVRGMVNEEGVKGAEDIAMNDDEEIGGGSGSLPVTGIVLQVMTDPGPISR